MLKTLVHIFRDSFLVVLVVAIFAGSALGTGLPYKFPIKSVGSFQLASFESGLALYQLNRTTYFYAISPLNDYIVDTKGNRDVNLTSDEFKDNMYTTQFDTATWLRAGDAFLGYFDRLDPYYTLETERLKLHYHAAIQGRSIQITKETELLNLRKIKSQGITYAFGPDDVVFEPQKGWIMFGKDLTKIRHIEALVPSTINIIINESSTSAITLDQVTVASPDLPGMVTISARKNQSLRVDPVYRLISVEETYPVATSSAKIQMQLSVNDYRTDL